MTPRCTMSWTKWYLISICLDRSWNTGFLDNRIPLWLSQSITVVSSTCPNNSLKSFHNQTTSQQDILATMYSASAVLKATDFCFLLIRTQGEATSRCALAIHHIANPIGISISMEFQTPDSVSQRMVDCAPKISQQILGTNPVNVMRINHMLTQSVHYKTCVRTGVH